MIARLGVSRMNEQDTSGDIADQAVRELADFTEAKVASICSQVAKYGNAGAVPEERPCFECGLPIGQARLEAIPNAVLCKTCKEQEES